MYLLFYHCREHRETPHRGDAGAQPLHIWIGGRAGLCLCLGGPRQQPEAPLLRQVVQGQRGILQVGLKLPTYIRIGILN